MNNRPEISQSGVGVAIARESVSIAESGGKPTVSLGGNIGWNDALLPDKNDNWSVTLSANWNVFDGGATKAKIQGAETAVEKALLQEKQVRDNVTLEVRQAYLSLNEAEKRIDTTGIAVSKAEEDVFIAHQRYNAGVGTNLDVIDAQLALTQSRNNYSQALYDFNISKAKLERAIGTAIN